jgi:hypothetical protein
MVSNLNLGQWRAWNNNNGTIGIYDANEESAVVTGHSVNDVMNFI